MAETIIIVGAGPSGIAMAHKLKHELGFEDFIIYDKLDGVGGTWRANSYPGWYVSLIKDMDEPHHGRFHRLSG